MTTPDAVAEQEMSPVSQVRHDMSPNEAAAPGASPDLRSGGGLDGGTPTPANSVADQTVDERATFVVDIARAEVVAGNGAARALFLGREAAADLGAGTSDLKASRVSARYTQSLDRSTPALTTLSRMTTGESVARLVFWTASGIIAVDASCTRVASPLGDVLVRVVVLPPGERSASQPARVDPPPTPQHRSPNDAELAVDQPVTQAPLRSDVVASAVPAAATAARATPAATVPAPLPGFDPTFNDGETLADIARRVRSTSTADTRGRGEDRSASPAAAEPPSADMWTDLKLAKLAHELRTPLSAVVALAEIMRDERLGPMANARYRGYAADIYESTHYALTLIQSVVDEARGEPVAAKALTAFDANRVITSSVSALDPFADRAGVTLVAALSPRLPVPAIEPRRLTQLLFNLLTNAFNHTPRGGRITVSAEARGGDGWLSLVVEDTGRGMSEVAIVKALSQQVNSARPGASPSGSTGFGVPIVRDIITESGGTIDITSEPGRGTRVAIALPPLRPQLGS